MGANPLHFIVAENDQDARQLIRGVLQKHYPEARISNAVDGREALGLYKRQGASMLIIDYELPEVGTLILDQALQTTPPAAAPLIMLSHQPAFEQKVMAAGAHWFVNKNELVRGLMQTLADSLPWVSAEPVSPALA